MTQKIHRYEFGDPAARAYSTDIDRRQCKRVVPMRVLGLGYSRSGTDSLRHALLHLGYDDCYHMASSLQENPRDQEMWLDALTAKYEGNGQPFTRADWDRLLGHCQAVTDMPCVLFYRELIEAYPEAKVVVTVRDSTEQWHRSALATIVPYYEGNRNASLPRRVLMWFMPIEEKMLRYVRLQFENGPIAKALVRDYRFGGRTAVERHDEYVKELKRLVPKENLLVMNVKEGWEPLCEFLGEDVPDLPFPKRNSTERFQKNTGEFGVVMRKLALLNMVKYASAGVVLGAALWIGASRYRGSWINISRLFQR